MCPRCNRYLVVIDVRLGEVTVTMHACSTCETHWWDCEGRRIELATVISLVNAEPERGRHVG